MTSNEGHLNGDPNVLQLDRAIGELRRGRVIGLRGADANVVIAAAELLRQPLLERLRAASAQISIVLTSQRAAALGLNAPGDAPVALHLAPQWDAAWVRALAGAATETPSVTAHGTPEHLPAQASMAAALGFLKTGRLLPALIWLDSAAHTDASLLSLDTETLEAHPAMLAQQRLERISEARVPLAESVDSRIVMFRDEHTLSEHVAIIVGEPQLHAAVPVRLHSACLTGDLLGSLRCDCGEQLRTAVARIAELGGGVLLYLDQEGRGIGLTNKLRAYALQDEGLDTLDADLHLGFLADERNFRIAAVLLRELGVDRVELLTNNPQKISALREHGIDVTGRRSLIAPTTEHNERYLRAKRERAGHLVEESGS